MDLLSFVFPCVVKQYDPPPHTHTNLKKGSFHLLPCSVIKLLSAHYLLCCCLLYGQYLAKNVLFHYSRNICIPYSQHKEDYSLLGHPNITACESCSNQVLKKEIISMLYYVNHTRCVHYLFRHD